MDNANPTDRVNRAATAKVIDERLTSGQGAIITAWRIEAQQQRNAKMKTDATQKKSIDKIIRQAEGKLRRSCGRETLFRIPGEGKLGEWRTIRHAYDAGVAAFLRGKYPTVIIANENITAAANWTFVNENGVD